MRKILIALDCDPIAQRVARIGFYLAKSLNAGVVLLHVTSEPAYYSSLDYSPITGFGSFSTTSIAENPDGVNEFAHRFLNDTKQVLGEGDIETMAVSGDFCENIVSTANNIKADMIVMGTHNRRGIDKMLIGSVAEAVLHKSSIPLLIIPPKAKDGK
jgi:nucleotide-binding universal stress UspA family protein